MAVPNQSNGLPPGWVAPLGLNGLGGLAPHQLFPSAQGTPRRRSPFPAPELSPGGGETGGNPAGQAGPGLGEVSGFSGPHMAMMGSFLGSVPGVAAPTLASAIGPFGALGASMLGAPTNPTSAVTSTLGGKIGNLTGVTNALSEASPLTANIMGQNLPAMAVNTPTSVIGLLGSLMGLGPAPATLAFDALGHAINTANVPGLQGVPSLNGFGNAQAMSLASLGGQAGGHAPGPTGQTSFDMSSPTYGGRGVTLSPPSPQLNFEDAPPDDPNAPNADPTNANEAPSDASGGGGGGGASWICGALYRRGMLTKKDLLANSIYKSRMTPEEYAGYSMWALPLVRFADSHPRASKILEKTLGRLALAYMKEIRTSGSSRLGRCLLTVGLPACRFLGKARRVLAPAHAR